MYGVGHAASLLFVVLFVIVVHARGKNFAIVILFIVIIIVMMISIFISIIPIFYWDINVGFRVWQV